MDLFGYVQNDPINRVDPLGLKTTIVITFDTSFGITYGSHSAMYIERAGEESFLYDPAGTYKIKERGTGGFFEGEAADLQDYIDYQKGTGSTVELVEILTTKEQEDKIKERAIAIGDPRGFSCARSVSDALGGVCGVTGSRFPGYLYDDAKKAKCGEE